MPFGTEINVANPQKGVLFGLIDELNRDQSARVPVAIATDRCIKGHSAGAPATVESSHRLQTEKQLPSRQEQEIAALRAQNNRLQASLAVAEQTLALRSQQATRVQYVLSDDSHGSFPASLFDSIPASVLKIFYTGAYQAPIDEHGRVMIDCDCKVWSQIHAFARCGAIPDGQQPVLLAQARLWNNEPLIETLEARVSGIAELSFHNDAEGFTARLNFVGLEFTDDTHVNSQCWEITAPCEQSWGVKVSERGIFCYPVKGKQAFVPRNQRFTLRLLLKDSVVQKTTTYAFDDHAEKTTFCCYNWSGWGYRLHEVLTLQARSRGCVVVELEINKGDSSPIA
ncbi:hypothetical protein WJX73_005325 [Symbiochloris irregularis]|uniref:Uncharacterized protein n=1 Tax=Symbiochloris irregularis TaxID=706552 RepID=A0AAW1NSN1_9CHLO